ncbi:Retrovirus-related Pol polyprotein from transposon TNT 1-94 [Dendrobium catenatum]|uniref:Retrovirus-related Pol polyprotein from transposon TNT 1-94 n=1 Tax=Dendrobium catenatum TaxID=906689 RepID=A0A2I0V6M5_9ASPA|nr:Retrovirus-related Pol polyprotein from transposon TNT 1-94 [Dendrobium catenatum]
MASSSSAASSQSTNLSERATNVAGIPANLKFVVSNLRTLVPTQLSTDNYAIWRSQIVKLLRANGFEQFLASSDHDLDRQEPTSEPGNISNGDTTVWSLTDQNLSAAICSTISSIVLPYVLCLESTAAVWKALETIFQSSNRSKVIQLKNELHNIQMNEQSMLQYLTAIKNLVDQIAAAGAKIENEDVIMYILNGLTPAYQAFKTTIRTMQTSLSLDNFYSLLISEEIHVKNDANKTYSHPNHQIALYANIGRPKRNRGRSSSTNQYNNRDTSKPVHVCHICNKKGRTATSCWHRLNVNYIPQSTSSDPVKGLAATTTNSHPQEWFLDSGASAHMTNASDNLSNPSIYRGSESVTIGDGRNLSIAQSGNGILPTPNRKLILSNLLHIPNISYNLLSISTLVRDNKISITFTPNGFVMKDLMTDNTLLHGPCKEGLYPIASSQPIISALSANKAPSATWHNRLGHPNNQTLRLLASMQPHLHISVKDLECISCKSCKDHKFPFARSSNRKFNPLELLHSDVWGPSPIASNQEFRYYVSFVDDYSQFTWLFPLKNKSEVFETFVKLKQLIENQFNSKIKILRTDGGAEYINNMFRKFLETNGIEHQRSCPYTPEQNGVAERKHRHIIEIARTLLHQASLSAKLWTDVVLTVVYLINRLPSTNTKSVSPFQLLYKEPPSYSHLKTFGCECFPLTPHTLRNKLQQKYISYVFLGYLDQYKGYKCYNRSTNSVSISRHVTFIEDSFLFKTDQEIEPSNVQNTAPAFLMPHSSVHTLSPRQNSEFQNLQTAQQIRQEPSKSLSNCNIPAKTTTTQHPMVTRLRTGSLRPRNRLNLIHHQSDNSPLDPTTYQEASKFPAWRQALASEFLALQRQGTWNLVPPPPSAPVLGCRWTFRTKRHADGSVARFKARLVAQGNHQEHGIDYLETFSPVAKLPTIRILITVALFHNWDIQQFDVENAFLHGTLSESLYEATKGL